MISQIQILDSLVKIAGWIAVIGFFYGPWQRLSVDLIRQKLFELRDASFDEAVVGKYEFTSQQYIVFRDFINTVIRSAHRLTLWRYVFYGVVAALTPSIKADTNYLSKILSGESADPLIKTKFNKACAWITLLIWLRSPALIVFTILLSIALPVIVAAAIVSVKIRHLPKLLLAAISRQIQREAVLEIEQQHGDQLLAG